MMRSKPEVENIDSKRMPVDSMTNKGEEYLCGEICTKGDKKHVKHNYRARLNKNTIGYIKNKTYFSTV